MSPPNKSSTNGPCDIFGCGPTAQQGCVLAFGLELLHACADFLYAFNMEIRQRSAEAYRVNVNTMLRIFTR